MGDGVVLKVLVYPYALTRMFRSIAKPLLLSLLAVFLGFMFLSLKVEATGGELFAGLRKMTGQSTLPLAISFLGFQGTIFTAGAWIGCIILGKVLSSILLIDAQSTVATVTGLRQTGASVNNMPVMAITMAVDSGGQSRSVSTNKLMDLGAMPRPGDRVRIAVSRFDPTCVRYLGA